MSFWRKISPTGAAKDFAQVWHSNPYRWRALAISVAITSAIMAVAIPESQRIPPEKPQITYITSFAPGRSDAEIIASNIVNQEKQDAIRADEERRAELRKQLYRELGRASGLDVDAMEREIAKDRPSERQTPEKQPAQEAEPPEAQRIGNE